MVSSGQGRTPYFLGCDVRTDSRTIATYNEKPVSGSWALYVETQDYRNEFEEKIVEHGGDKVDYILLWSSTRYDEDPTWKQPWYVDFGGGAGCCTTQSEVNLSYVRAARVF